ncbi:MAG TPA: hypothetical protein P5277_02435 [Candidatus Paceibacterota bacterium]|nr:hypothetical protein [Candidatus Paceibacterota bacterium]
MIKKNKRGISPIVATVILIAIVVVIGIVILLWATNIFGEKAQKFGEDIDQSCKNIQLTVTYDSGNLEISNDDVTIPLYQLQLNVETDGGNEPFTLELDGGIAPGSSMAIDDVLNKAGASGGTLTSVSPILIGEADGNPRAVPCSRKISV